MRCSVVWDGNDHFDLRTVANELITITDFIGQKSLVGVIDLFFFACSTRQRVGSPCSPPTTTVLHVFVVARSSFTIPTVKPVGLRTLHASEALSRTSSDPSSTAFLIRDVSLFHHRTQNWPWLLTEAWSLVSAIICRPRNQMNPYSPVENASCHTSEHHTRRQNKIVVAIHNPELYDCLMLRELHFCCRTCNVNSHPE